MSITEILDFRMSCFKFFNFNVNFYIELEKIIIKKCENLVADFSFYHVRFVKLNDDATTDVLV